MLRIFRALTLKPSVGSALMPVWEEYCPIKINTGQVRQAGSEHRASRAQARGRSQLGTMHCRA